MAGVNKVILLGHLGKDPEVRTFDGGSRKAQFSLATSESFMDKNGQRQDKVEWHTVIFWGKIVDVIEKYLKKGSQVYIEGKITTRSYDDKDGQKKYITEILGSTLTMLGSKSQSSESGSDGKMSPEEQQQATLADASDDLPF